MTKKNAFVRSVLISQYFDPKLPDYECLLAFANFCPVLSRMRTQYPPGPILGLGTRLGSSELERTPLYPPLGGGGQHFFYYDSGGSGACPPRHVFGVFVL